MLGQLVCIHTIHQDPPERVGSPGILYRIVQSICSTSWYMGSSSVDALLTCPRPLLCSCCSCSRPFWTAPVQVCGLDLHLPSPLNTHPSACACMYNVMRWGALENTACHFECLGLSGQQTQVVSDREGFSARVQQVGVWCRCVACFFWPVLPPSHSVLLLCCLPRFPAAVSSPVHNDDDDDGCSNTWLGRSLTSYWQ